MDTSACDTQVVQDEPTGAELMVRARRRATLASPVDFERCGDAMIRVGLCWLPGNEPPR